MFYLKAEPGNAYHCASEGNVWRPHSNRRDNVMKCVLVRTIRIATQSLFAF